jgi:hypothetical protein
MRLFVIDTRPAIRRLRLADPTRTTTDIAEDPDERRRLRQFRSQRMPCEATGVLTILLLGLLPSSGCSFVLVDGPPPASASAMQVECTTSRVAPIVDTIVAIAQVYTIGFAATASDAEYESRGVKISRGWDVVAGAAVLGLFGASAVVGYGRVNDCRRAKAEEASDIVKRQGEWQRIALRQQRMLAVRADGADDDARGRRGARPAEDAAITEAFAGRVVRSCWLVAALPPDDTSACSLEGDFDGDGKPDAAVLVVEAASPRRRGIALLTSDAEPAVLGAGGGIGRGADDFKRMTGWRVLKRQETGRRLRGAAGDGLVVEQNGAPMGLMGVVDGRAHWANGTD